MKRLKGFNITVAPGRGKGSERVLIQPSGHHSKYIGPQISIKHHGRDTEYSPKVIDAILRRFDINPNKFWR